MRRAHIGLVLGVLLVGIAPAIALADSAKDKYRAAQKLAADDDNEAALALVDQGLKLAPKDLDLLQLRGTLLLKTRDYEGALAAYQAYLDAGARGANRREAQKIINSLGAVKTTSVEIKANTDATIYLDTKTAGTFCTTPCKKALLPDTYKVIAERAGFERYTGRLVVAPNTMTAHAITLVEKQSPLKLSITPAGATVLVDGKPFSGTTLPAGDHKLEIRLAGYANHQQQVSAREGKPIELSVELAPFVAIVVLPADATLELDGKPIAAKGGGIAIPIGAKQLVATAPKHHTQKIDIPADRKGFRIDIKLAEVGTALEFAGAPKGSKVSIDGKVVGTLPLREPIEVSPGTHTIEIAASGYRPYKSTTTFLPDRRGKLTIEKLRRDDRRRTLIAAISTGVAFGAAMVFSLNALRREDLYNERARTVGVMPDDPQLAKFKDSGSTASLFADVGFGLTLAGAAITTYLFLNEGRGESEGSLRFGVGPTGAMARVSF